MRKVSIPPQVAWFLAACLVVVLLVGAGEVTGNLGTGVVKNQHVSASAAIDKSKLATRTLQAFPVPLTSLRKWDALEQILPATPATTYLGLVTGTFGSGPPQAQTGDLKTAGATTRRARAILSLPTHYAAGGGIQIRCVSGMKTTVADTSSSIDIECYQLLDDGTLSADLCTTAAQSINSLTYATKTFTIDPTGLVAGNRLDVRVSITVTDGASGTAVVGLLHSLLLNCDVTP